MCSVRSTPYIDSRFIRDGKIPSRATWLTILLQDGTFPVVVIARNNELITNSHYLCKTAGSSLGCFNETTGHDSDPYGVVAYYVESTE